MINSSAGTVKLQEDEGRGEQESLTLVLPAGAVIQKHEITCAGRQQLNSVPSRISHA